MLRPCLRKGAPADELQHIEKCFGFVTDSGKILKALKK